MLATSDQTRSLYYLRRIYAEVETRFKYEISDIHRLALLFSTCRFEQTLEETIAVLDSIEDQSTVDWTALLEYTLQHCSGTTSGMMSQMLIVYDRMKKIRQPAEQDMEIMLRGVKALGGVREMPTLKQSRFVEDLEALGDKLSVAALGTMLSIEAESGDIEAAENIKSQIEQITSDPSHTDAQRREELDTLLEEGYTEESGQREIRRRAALRKRDILRLETWVGLCDLAIAKDDTAELQTLVSEMVDCGYTPQPNALVHLIDSGIGQNRTTFLNHIVEGDRLKGALPGLRHIPGLQVTAAHWTAFIRHFVNDVDHDNDAREPDSASVSTDELKCDVLRALYPIIRQHGVELDIELAACLTAPLPELVRNDDMMWSIYDELSNNGALATCTGRQFRVRREYINQLLSHCGSGGATLDQTTRALRDLRHFGIQVKLAQVFSPLMRAISQAQTYQAAYDLYHEIYSVFGSRLDRRHFESIVEALLDLSPKAPTFILPPSELFTSMLKDMNNVGLRPDGNILAALIRKYGRLASDVVPNPRDRRERLLTLEDAVKDLHAKLKLDPSIQLSMPILNSLLDAYNRIGLHQSWLDTWDEIVERRQREPLEKARHFMYSVSIALDFCGYKKLDKKADRIWAWAIRWKFINYKTVESRLECLCRLDNFDEAWKLITGIQTLPEAEISVDRPKVDENLLKVYLKLSWRLQRRGRNICVENVQTTFPELWPLVSHVVDSEDYRQGEQVFEFVPGSGKIPLE